MMNCIVFFIIIDSIDGIIDNNNIIVCHYLLSEFCFGYSKLIVNNEMKVTRLYNIPRHGPLSFI